MPVAVFFWINALAYRIVALWFSGIVCDSSLESLAVLANPPVTTREPAGVGGVRDGSKLVG